MTQCQIKTFPSVLDHLPSMLRFVRDKALSVGCNAKLLKQIELVAEEALVNIVHYAYPAQSEGKISISCQGSVKVGKLVIEIRDQGVPYNPLKEPVSSPENLPLQERKVGGLGRFFILKLMDQVSYVREGDTNILRMVKEIH